MQASRQLQLQLQQSFSPLCTIICESINQPTQHESRYQRTCSNATIEADMCWWTAGEQARAAAAGRADLRLASFSQLLLSCSALSKRLSDRATGSPAHTPAGEVRNSSLQGLMQSPSFCV